MEQISKKKIQYNYKVENLQFSVLFLFVCLPNLKMTFSFEIFSVLQLNITHNLNMKEDAETYLEKIALIYTWLIYIQ